MEFLIGIDLGGTDIKSVVMKENGEILSKRTVPTGNDKRPVAVVNRLASDISKNLRESGFEKKDLIGIGVGCPGPLNSKTGIVECAPNLKGWKNVPFRKMLTDALSLPIHLFNDANAAAYGEFWQGAGKGFSNFILYTLGTGIGGGIILNKKLFTGIDGSAGELGHVTLIPDGPPCPCGNRGCLEALASATSIVRNAREGIKKGTETLLNKNYESDSLTAKDISEAASAGDRFAISILSEAGRFLGIAAAAIINTLNPEVIAYGGGMSNAGDILFDSIRKEAGKRCFEKPWGRVRIIPASLGNSAGMIGAAGLILAKNHVK